MSSIEQTKILIIATHGFEQSELTVPRDKLRAVGATVHVAAPQPGRIRGWQHDDWGDYVAVDKALEEVEVHDYDALVLPGGKINPDLLRINLAALRLIKAFIDAHKVVAAICHAPWLLIEVDAVKGRRVTAYRSIKTDVRNAGGRWVEASAVADRGIVTSRSAADLDAFVEKIIEEMGEIAHTQRREAAA